MQFFFGAFLCDLSQHPGHVAWLASRKWPGRVLSPLLIIFGLYLASYPELNPDFMPWSNYMLQTSFLIFPKEAEIPRFYTGIGLLFIALGIHFSTFVKNVLSSQHLLWFGKNSFAVYLLHGTLLRTLLVWMYFGIHTPPDIINEQGQPAPGPPLKLCGRARFWFWLPIWLVILYSIANLWTKHVDPWCARLTQKIEKYVFDDGKDEVEKNNLLSPLPR
jgi:peptidoglycan/LPS O-acetylase OafA/YrhL